MSLDVGCRLATSWLSHYFWKISIFQNRLNWLIAYVGYQSSIESPYLFQLFLLPTNMQEDSELGSFEACIALVVLADTKVETAKKNEITLS